MQTNEKTDLFLDTYRRLETTAERIVGDDDRSGSSIIRLCRTAKYAPYREQLDYCREVRNLLSHEAKVDGEYAVIPSDAMQTLLETVLQKIENPKRVHTVMTPVEQLVTVNLQTPVRAVMRRMQRQNISHVPILKNGRVSGIFSVGTVFQAILNAPESFKIDETNTVGDFAEYLPLDKHMGQSFRFIAQDLSLEDASAVFDTAYNRSSKLKLLLVTQNGNPEEKLLGVVSPYDLLG